MELRNSGIPQPRLTLSYAEFRIHGSRLNLRPILPKHGRANAELGYKMQHFLEIPRELASARVGEFYASGRREPGNTPGCTIKSRVLQGVRLEACR